jgi:hypothetical protein
LHHIRDSLLGFLALLYALRRTHYPTVDVANDLATLCRGADHQPSPCHVSREPMVVRPQSRAGSVECVWPSGGKTIVVRTAVHLMTWGLVHRLLAGVRVHSDGQ